MKSLNQTFSSEATGLEAAGLRAGQVDQVSLLKLSSGRVWVTQQGRAEDFWLDGGDTLVLLPGSLIVIEAAGASRLQIEPIVLNSTVGLLQSAGRMLDGAAALSVRHVARQLRRTARALAGVSAWAMHLGR
ncbi:DUF2917 domain-containing protein [Herbaspirillum lusitanum]|uniref:DUF2917 domain-containing protein n=1 Tax=Herbaspirillum lusitanum TaxID=213312 RepID=A0ABW9ACZ7_9BURK